MKFSGSVCIRPTCKWLNFALQVPMGRGLPRSKISMTWRCSRVITFSTAQWRYYQFPLEDISGAKFTWELLLRCRWHHTQWKLQKFKYSSGMKTVWFSASNSLYLRQGERYSYNGLSLCPPLYHIVSNDLTWPLKITSATWPKSTSISHTTPF